MDQQLNLMAPTAREADEEILRHVELQQRAEKAWSDAWDRAAKRDVKQGRPYDRHRYARLAHLASVRVLGVCKSPRCKEHAKTAGVSNA